MTEKPLIGDIYEMFVKFDDNSQTKKRPILVLNVVENSDLVLVVALTGSKTNDGSYFDSLKHPIKDWQKAGLRKQSWVKPTNTEVVGKNVLCNFKGTVTIEDYVDAVYKVIEFENIINQKPNIPK